MKFGRRVSVIYLGQATSLLSKQCRSETSTTTSDNQRGVVSSGLHDGRKAQDSLAKNLPRSSSAIIFLALSSVAVSYKYSIIRSGSFPPYEILSWQLAEFFGGRVPVLPLLAPSHLTRSCTVESVIISHKDFRDYLGGLTSTIWREWSDGMRLRANEQNTGQIWIVHS